MKFRLLFAIAVLSIFVAPALAQTPNCVTVSANKTGDLVNYNPGNQYIVNETVTWTVKCINTNNKTTTPASNSPNAETATGSGGWTPGFNSTFIACSPIFGYTLKSATTTASDGYFWNVGQDNTYDSSLQQCAGSAYHINKSYCTSVACSGCKGICQCDPNYPDPCCCGSSPIILDISGNGFVLTSAANGVKFDISGTGNPIQMGWIAPGADNAFLALPAPDGLVHNGQQLFGNFTPQPPCPAGDTTCSPNGFRALAVYDQPANGGNGDGIIDSRDAIFSSLRLWVDANHDGISQPEELHALASLGVNSISLNYKMSEKTDQYGNVFRYRAQLNPDKPTDAGKTAYDVFFVVLGPATMAQSCPAPPATGKRPASPILKH